MFLRQLLQYFVALIMLSLTFGYGLAQVLPAYHYAYLTDGGTLHLVNPEDTGAGEQIITVPFTKGEFVYHFQVSPNGEWISYILDPNPGTGDLDSSNGQLRLYNVLTGEVRDEFIRSVFNDIVWSPNSRYLALDVTDDEFSHVQFATYIYDLQMDKFHYLLEANTYRYGLTWSPDSTHLSVASNICSNVACDSKIDVIRIPEYQVIKDASFSSVSAPLCNFAWSPDNKLLSFVFACDIVGFPYISDIFNLDVATGKYTQLTTFTQTLAKVMKFDDPNAIFRTYYDLIWYDADHLLVGVNSGRFQDGVGYDPATVQVMTNFYHATGTSKPASSAMLTNWLLNPVDGTVAFRAEQKALQTNEDNIPLFVNQTVSVQVARLEEDDLKILYSEPLDACDLNWSPEGKYLAYIQYHTRGCGSPTLTNQTNVYFLNSANGKVTQFSSPSSSLRPIGWVAVN